MKKNLAKLVSVLLVLTIDQKSFLAIIITVEIII